MSEKWTKAFKGFNKDMTCRGFQYPESGEVHVSDTAKICEKGVHACEEPLDVFRYYSPAISIFREVEIKNAVRKLNDDETKICGTDIRIGAKLDIAGIVKAQFDYVKSNTTNENNAELGKPASAGNYGAASAGESGAASAGESGAASAGESGAAVSRGTAAVEKYGAALVRGNLVKAKGGIGSVLVIVEENSIDFEIKSWCAGVVDGENLQPDVWYCCKDGKFVEAENDSGT